jgi:hypothetical protein
MQLATAIVCVECGGTARLATPIAEDDELEAGDVVVYRCDDCYGRFDVVVDEDDLDDPSSSLPEPGDARG